MTAAPRATFATRLQWRLKYLPCNLFHGLRKTPWLIHHPDQKCLSGRMVRTEYRNCPKCLLFQYRHRILAP